MGLLGGGGGDRWIVIKAVGGGDGLGEGRVEVARRKRSSCGNSGGGDDASQAGLAAALRGQGS